MVDNIEKGSIYWIRYGRANKTGMCYNVCQAEILKVHLRTVSFKYIMKNADDRATKNITYKKTGDKRDQYVPVDGENATRKKEALFMTKDEAQFPIDPDDTDDRR